MAVLMIFLSFRQNYVEILAAGGKGFSGALFTIVIPGIL